MASAWIYVVYGLYEPEEMRWKSPRYIGLTRQRRTRLLRHLRGGRGRAANFPVNRWIRLLAEQGQQPHMEVLCEMHGPFAYEACKVAEREFISWFRTCGADLLNVVHNWEVAKHPQPAAVA